MSKKEPAKQSFEDSITELENIVNAMEENQLPLEELIAHYERGATLHQQCEAFLTSAKTRLETIANSKTKSTAPTPSRKPITNDDDEIRLF